MMATLPLPPIASAMALQAAWPCRYRSAPTKKQALVGLGGLGVEGGDRDAGVHGLVDEGHHAGVTGDGGDGIVLLDDGRLDGRAKDLAGVLVAGHDPVDGHAVGLQFFGGLQRAFLDRDPERVVLQTQHGDLHRLGRFLIHRLDRRLVGRGAHFLGSRQPVQAAWVGSAALAAGGLAAQELSAGLRRCLGGRRVSGGRGSGAGACAQQHGYNHQRAE